VDLQAELYSWGAAEEVTGSKHFLRFHDQLIQVDCGAFQGHRDESDRKNREWPFNPAEVDALVLSHAHYDHSGLIPLMAKKNFSGNIYTTPASRDLANLIMMDSAHIQVKDLEFLKKRALKRGEPFSREPLYKEEDVIQSLDQFITVSYDRSFPVTENIQVRFIDAGHILGAALPVVTVGKNGQQMVIGLGGDLGRKGLPILRDPQPLPDLDYLVIESTYGHRRHDPIETATEKLAEVVNRTTNRGGKIIIPAFAIERTQELIYFLHLLNDAGKIPKLPIYVDSPMATNATSIFQVHQECYDEETHRAFLDHHKNPFGFNELRYTTNVSESKELNALQDPAIIISSSGMCEAGRILHHLANNIENPHNTIVIVGFMAQDTLGRRIKEQTEQVKIFGDIYKLRAEVVTLNTFSAHADEQDIIDTVKQLDFKRLKEIFLVHGESDAQAALSETLRGLGYKTTIIRYKEKYTLQV
jgi:metallo-beta-lactamase family protein